MGGAVKRVHKGGLVNNSDNKKREVWGKTKSPNLQCSLNSQIGRDGLLLCRSPLSKQTRLERPDKISFKHRCLKSIVSHLWRTVSLFCKSIYQMSDDGVWLKFRDSSLSEGNEGSTVSRRPPYSWWPLTGIVFRCTRPMRNTRVKLIIYIINYIQNGDVYVSEVYLKEKRDYRHYYSVFVLMCWVLNVRERWFNLHYGVKNGLTTSWHL